MLHYYLVHTIHDKIFDDLVLQIKYRDYKIIYIFKALRPYLFGNWGGGVREMSSVINWWMYSGFTDCKNAMSSGVNAMLPPRMLTHSCVVSSRM